MTFWAYMLHCQGGYFYVGHTDDLERRIAQHQMGALPGFSRDDLPVELVWSAEFPTRIEALEAERRIKGWGRPKKARAHSRRLGGDCALGEEERQRFDKLSANGKREDLDKVRWG